MNAYIHDPTSAECSCGWKREDDWELDEFAVRRWGADA